MKQIVILAVAVMIGIWVYRKFSNGTGVKSSNRSTSDAFEGPDIDPKTGAYLGPGAQTGTVEFSAQGN